MLGARDEIIEDILLFRQISLLMPAFAVLSTASEIGHDIDAAMIEPEVEIGRKMRRHADAVATVAIKQRWIFPVAPEAFAIQDCHRNTGTVLGSRKLAFHFDVAEVDRRLGG